MYGTLPCFFFFFCLFFFYKGNIFCNSLVASLYKKALQNLGVLLKEKIRSLGNSVLIEITSIEKGKN